MSRKSKISDIYRKQVDVFIDDQSGPKLHYNPLNQEELDEIWEGIYTEMDLGDVWSEISSALDNITPADPPSVVFVKSIAVVLIILIGMIPTSKTIIDPGIIQTKSLSESKLFEHPAEMIDKNKFVDTNFGDHAHGDISLELKRHLNIGDESKIQSPDEANKKQPAEGISGFLSGEGNYNILDIPKISDSIRVNNMENIRPERFHISPAPVHYDLEKANALPKTGFNSLKVSNYASSTGLSFPSPNRGNISIGLITLFKNTWLLNQETFNGLKSETYNTTEIIFFPDVGLSLNYLLDKSWSLQTEGFFYSNTGQEYLDYINGNYGRKRITLKYSTITFSVKYRAKGQGPLIPHASLNLITGCYLSVLHFASQKINTVVEDIGSKYENFDFGVRLGSEYEMQIFDKMSFAPGLFLSIGIPNIYRGDSKIPAYLERTHNGSAEFHLSFYYHFD